MSLSYRPVVVCCECLEPRALFAISYPSDQEQLVVELINRGRADPLAEAARYGIALNEGVPAANTIAATPKQPLAINLNLTAAARAHGTWMIESDVFSHTGEGGSSPHARMAASGYAFTGSYVSGENLAYRGTTGWVDVNATSAQLHADLFVDTNYPGRGHRVNQMNAAYREIGAGVATGAYTNARGMTFNAVMGAENFAKSGTNAFLTGVAYTDGVVDDNFYTIGESIAGLTVTAVRAGDNATFTTQTWGSGGYSLALPPGTYTVSTQGGGAIGGTITHGNVVIADQNVKRDFRPDMVSAPFATLVNGHLEINGTPGRDAMSLTQSGGTLIVSRDGAVQQFNAAAVTSIAIYLGDDADGLTVGPGVMGLYCDGGMGNDHLIGGEFNDTLTGNGNHDKLYGGRGDDRMNGSGGHDKLFGEEGRDRMHGGAGMDTLDGGAHIDRLFPESGNDTILGQHGLDLMYTIDGEADFLAGGSGWDTAEIDVGLDLLESVEDWY